MTATASCPAVRVTRGDGMKGAPSTRLHHPRSRVTERRNPSGFAHTGPRQPRQSAHESWRQILEPARLIC